MKNSRTQSLSCKLVIGRVDVGAFEWTRLCCAMVKKEGIRQAMTLAIVLKASIRKEGDGL